MHHAIVVGVGQQHDTSPANYAEADAQAFADVLAASGVTCEVLLGSAATKATLEATVRRVTRSLTADDTIFLFYAGRGASLAVALDLLKKSAANRVAVFLDADDLDERELRKLLSDKTNKLAAFVACANAEKSYASLPLGHGIWAHHLVEALAGNAPLAIKEGLLTASALQRHLAAEVAKTVRIVREMTEVQTPWACGAEDLVIADLSDILRARQTQKLAAAKEATQAVLKGERTAPIQRLSGFTKKIHRIPDAANAKANSFVAQIAHADVRAHLDTVYADLRSHLGYKRRDLTDAEDSGLGTIQTPDFHYAVSIRVDEADPSMAVWSYEVSKITDEQVIASLGFDSALGKYLDTIEYEFRTAFDVEAFIDTLEDQELPGVNVDYERGSSACQVRLDGFVGVLVFTPAGFRVTGIERPTPRALIEGLVSARRLLVEKHKVLALTQ